MNKYLYVFTKVILSRNERKQRTGNLPLLLWHGREQNRKEGMQRWMEGWREDFKKKKKGWI